LQAEILKDRDARHTEQISATAQVTAIESERDDLLKKLIELEEHKQAIMQQYELEKTELLKQVEAKDTLIESKVKEIKEKDEQIKVLQPEAISCEVDVDTDTGMSNLLDRALAETGIDPDVTIFELFEPELEFIFE